MGDEESSIPGELLGLSRCKTVAAQQPVTKGKSYQQNSEMVVDLTSGALDLLDTCGSER